MLTLQFPTEIEESVYSSAITQGESDDSYVFQTCRVSLSDDTVIFQNNNSNIGIENFYNKIMEIEDFVIQQISLNSEKWFDSVLEVESIKNDLFKRAITVPKLFGEPYKMKVELDADVKVYDNKQKPIDNYKNLLVDNEATLLLQVKDVIITSQVAKLRIVVLQMMIHKKPEPKLTSFVIQDDPEEFEKLGLFKKKKKAEIKKVDTEKIKEHAEIKETIKIVLSE